MENNFIVINSNSRGDSSTLAQENKATVFGVSSVSNIGSLSTGISSKTEGIYLCKMEVLSWYADENKESLTSCISEIENSLSQTTGIYFVSPNKYVVYLPANIALRGEEAVCSYIGDVLRENPCNYVYKNAISSNNKTASGGL